MEGRAIRGVIAGALCALTFCVASAAVVNETGQYALAQGQAKITSRLSLTDGAFGTQTLALVQYPLHSASPLKRYALIEGEMLHVVVVRDDFQSFGHLHPLPSKAASSGFPSCSNAATGITRTSRRSRRDFQNKFFVSCCNPEPRRII
jgi:hypothetical protein